VYFPPYDHVDVIEGQGTCMVEVAEQVEDIWGAGTTPDIILCPIGGGGLMSGVAIASKGFWGDKGVKVIGAEPSGGLSGVSVTWHELICIVFEKAQTMLMKRSIAKRGSLLSLRSIPSAMGS
jgi:threonine dehydratase